MQNLINVLNGNDVFGTNQEISDLVREYHERSERKRDDDKWLKANKSIITKTLTEMGKAKADFGNVRVSMTIPDQSHFNEDKVLEYALQKGVFELITKPVLDEDALIIAIEKGVIDLDELKEFAWVEKQGTERILIKKVETND